jgi:Ca-activated chloride channel family protein
LLAIAALSCGLLSSGGPPSNAVIVEVAANSGLKPWLEGAVEAFNEERFKTEDGRPVYAQLTILESGQAVSSLAGGSLAPDLWIPEGEVWSDLLAAEGLPDYQGDCLSLAHSPLVIAMWRPVAESLGWPGRELGWLDVGSLAADPSAWAYYSGGQFGSTLRLGHTHPGLSGSGVATLLAVVQAAQSKLEAVTTEEIEQPIVQASVGAFEGAVSWFSSSTDALGQTMRDRGLSYLAAGVMYESTVLHYGGGDPEIIPIYPFEGTFLATHSACLNQGGQEEDREGASLLRAYLLGESAQRQAMEQGLRPADEAVELEGPFQARTGVDPDQPAVTFESPTVEAIYAIQDLWQQARKDVNLVMLLDVSGSMEGEKIDNVRRAAEQFVRQMGEEDWFTLIAFSNDPQVLITHEQVGASREVIIRILNSLRAEGNTTLYDAIGQASALIAQTSSPQRVNAMVVLTDGMDTASSRFGYSERLIAAASANETTIFTIAYGNDADQGLLKDLANRANGRFYVGGETEIGAIYQEMSAAFGGTVGVGR